MSTTQKRKRKAVDMDDSGPGLPLCSSMNGGAKGNNGKAARSRRNKQIMAVVATVGLCGILFLVVHPQGSHRELTEHIDYHDDHHHENGLLGDMHNHGHRGRSLGFKRGHKRSPLDILGGRAPTEGVTSISSSDPMSHPAWQDILHARVHLVDLHGSKNRDDPYEDAFAVFCKVDWEKHKEDPSGTPMYRDVIANSPACEDEPRIRAPLATVVDRVRRFDEKHPGTAKILDLTAAVFHESRCGSTLVANVLTKYNPEQHRVYSEPSPPINAMIMICGEDDDGCSPEDAQRLLRDTLYLMGRSDDHREERFFVKFQSLLSTKIGLFQETFPQVPFMYVYRDPVQVMVSQLRVPKIRNANCVRRQSSGTSSRVQRLLGRARPVGVDPVEYCAAHLASLTESAAYELDDEDSLGVPVNYRDLPDALWSDWLPPLLNLGEPVDVDDLKQVAGQYSKGRDNSPLKGEFHEDNAKKDDAATDAMKSAALKYMQRSYDTLERLSMEAKGED